MPRADSQDAAVGGTADRAGVAVADLGDVDGAVAGEVAAGHQVEHVAARNVRAGDPAGAVDDAGVEEVADAGGLLLAERAGADVALGQRGPRGEVGLAEGLEDDALAELGLEPLGVDLAVAGQPDGQRLDGAVGVA